ncbi:hypothetical protein [Devosia sp. SL43]|uniref:hypothetical protein n=1 Tax=Devosia sp. SL43 TaxID=2806348 RepID=UPI001F375840|nr:hypothetical protein [Devosia sp. SL43]UJW87952.1 hypothetical protein IM737_20575 [Devosia sp. SL43]
MALPARPYAVEDFADLLKLRAAPFIPMPMENVSELGSGEFLTADMGPTLYQAACETAPMPNAEAHGLMALIQALGGSKECFYLPDYMRLYPAADPDGSILAASAPTIHTIGGDRRTMRITGLPAGYVITRGDYIAVDYGSPSRRALIKAAETVTASGAGLTPSFAVSYPIGPGVTTTLAVILKKPAAKVKMVPGTLSISPVDILNAVISFTARQTTSAG